MDQILGAEVVEEPPIYHIENGHCYILLEEDFASRETSNLIIAIKLAREKIACLQQAMQSLEEDSEEYDQLQDEKNDHEFMIADFEHRFERLLNLPRY